MIGAEAFKDVREMSGGRFENSQLGRQAEGMQSNLNEEKEVAESSENIRVELTEEEKQKYIQEVWNPGTDFDFSEFDFQDKGLDRMLNYFAEPTWEGLDIEDKKSVITGYIGNLTIGLDISKTPNVDIRPLPKNYCGAYNDKNNTIIINSALLDNPKELAGTISHEMRHAYQHERAGKCETLQDALYKLNIENYIYPVKDEYGNWCNYNEYEDQLVEAEADAFAKKITDRMEG